MADVVLLRDGRAHEIWRNTTKAALADRYHPSVLAQCVEVTGEVKEGDAWDGSRFAAPPRASPPPAPTKAATPDLEAAVALLMAKVEHLEAVNTELRKVVT